MNFRQEKGVVDDCPDHRIQKGWSNFKNNNFSTIVEEDSSMNSFKSPGNQPLNSIATSSQCTATCAGVSTSFPISSVSYDYSSSLLQTLFDTEPQPQQPLYLNRSMNYPSTTSYQNEYSSLAKLQTTNNLHISTNPNFCNGPAAALNDFRASFFPSTQSQFLSSTFTEKPNLSGLTTKVKGFSFFHFRTRVR